MSHVWKEIYQPWDPTTGDAKNVIKKIDQAAENTFYMPTVYANDGGSVGEFVPIVE